MNIALVTVASIEGSPIPNIDQFGIIRGLKTYQGEEVISRPNESFIDSIKKLKRSEVFNYRGNLPTDSILRFFDSYNNNLDGYTKFTIRKSYFHVFIYVGMIFFALSFFLGLKKEYIYGQVVILLLLGPFDNTKANFRFNQYDSANNDDSGIVVNNYGNGNGNGNGNSHGSHKNQDGYIQNVPPGDEIKEVLFEAPLYTEENKIKRNPYSFGDPELTVLLNKFKMANLDEKEKVRLATKLLETRHFLRANILYNEIKGKNSILFKEFPTSLNYITTYFGYWKNRSRFYTLPEIAQKNERGVRLRGF